MKDVENQTDFNTEQYIQKLKELPPLDEKIESRLRAIANAILDRLEESNNNLSTEEANANV